MCHMEGTSHSLHLSLQGFPQQILMRHLVPEEDFLFFLRPNAPVLVQEFQKLAPWLLQNRIDAWLEVAQIGEDSLLEFLGVQYASSHLLEVKNQDLDYICPCNEEPSLPKDATNLFAVGHLQFSDGRIGRTAP